MVIGSSAGGIESLSVLVSNLPEEFPAPIVIGQHLAPNRLSALGDILARRSRLPVRTIEEVQPLEPGVIYVVPPHRNVRVTDHELSLTREGDGPQPSIDLLFRSASQVFGENVVAVVMSGTGSDGAEGAREVKSAGGTVIIEDPDTAAFPGMPLSLARSAVDIVASPRSALVRFSPSSYRASTSFRHPPSNPSCARSSTVCGMTVASIFRPTSSRRSSAGCNDDGGHQSNHPL